MKKIAIVGVGALGSHVAQFLRNEAQLRLIDFDRVEQKNTLAQFYGKQGVGKLKAQALASQLQFTWGVALKPEQVLTHRLDNSNVDVMLKGCDLVIDCLDNGASRRVLQAWTRTHKGACPVLHGGLATNGEYGRVIWDRSFVIDDEPADGVATCEGGEHLPFISLVSAYIARSAQIFLQTGNQIGFSVTPIGAIPV